MTKDIRVPGVIWAIALIIIVALIHENQAYLEVQFGVTPYIIDLLVAILIGILKGLSLGTEQLNQALDIIERIVNRPVGPRPPGEGMRAPGTAGSTVIIPDDEIPRRPNPFTRWLVG
jgi:hypothetical protein